MYENSLLIFELGHILYRRNLIETRRSRAMSKIGYYKQLKRVVDAYRGYSPTLKRLQQEFRRLTFPKRALMSEDETKLAHLTYRIAQENKYIEALIQQNSKPIKWLNDISALKKSILKYELEYLKAKYDAAKLTCATRKRVMFLIKTLKVRLTYRNGAVIYFSHTDHARETTYWHNEKFKGMYNEVESIRAVENMLKGKYGNKSKQEKS